MSNSEYTKQTFVEELKKLFPDVDERDAYELADLDWPERSDSNIIGYESSDNRFWAEVRVFSQSIDGEPVRQVLYTVCGGYPGKTLREAVQMAVNEHAISLSHDEAQLKTLKRNVEQSRARIGYLRQGLSFAILRDGLEAQKKNGSLKDEQNHH